MPDAIDIPAALLNATSITWKMETNHALAASPFSGVVQAQRGQLERWSFTMELRRLTREEMQIAQGFFLALEASLGLFRMHDPAARLPLGRATGTPVLAATADPGDRTLSISGFTPSVSNILRAGDWIQIGDQLAKVVADISSDAAGLASVTIWPKVMVEVASGQPVTVREAKGIFRFTTQLPEWTADSSERGRPYTTMLAGVQEVLTE
jgi:hypothetical protein